MKLPFCYVQRELRAHPYLLLQNSWFPSDEMVKEGWRRMEKYHRFYKLLTMGLDYPSGAESINGTENTEVYKGALYITDPLFSRRKSYFTSLFAHVSTHFTVLIGILAFIWEKQLRQTQIHTDRHADRDGEEHDVQQKVPWSEIKLWHHSFLHYQKHSSHAVCQEPAVPVRSFMRSPLFD